MGLTVQMVDVFGARPLAGNPLAVVSGDGVAELGDAEMQRITHWFNLSETTFLLPPSHPEADYRVRIFSPRGELPFAGHPTLGTAHAWLAAGGEPKDRDEIVQECAIGVVPIRRDASGVLSFAAPPLIRSGAPSAVDLRVACAFLGVGLAEVVDAAWIDNGPGWLGIELASSARVLGLRPYDPGKGPLKVGAVGPHPVSNNTANAAGGDPGENPAFEVRAFISDGAGSLVEDPVTGSLNAAIGQWFFAKGTVTAPYVAAQGTRLGREGRVRVSADPSGQVWVGGATRSQVCGTLTR